MSASGRRPDRKVAIVIIENVQRFGEEAIGRPFPASRLDETVAPPGAPW